MEESVDDDIRDLYADVEVQASLAISSFSTKRQTEPETQLQNNHINADFDKIVPNSEENNFGVCNQIMKTKGKKAREMMNSRNAKKAECEMVGSSGKEFGGADRQENRLKQIQGLNPGFGGYAFAAPWFRAPGVNVSNYFNFGYTNDSWRQYCVAREQLLHQQYIHGYELAQRHKAYAYDTRSHHAKAQPTVHEDVNQVGSSSKCDKEVDDNSGECHPTVDIGSRHVEVSDVVRKINGQDSCSVSTGYGKKKLSHADNSRSETSNSRNSSVNGTKVVQSSLSAGGVNLSVEPLQKNIRCNSSLERCPLPSLESGEISLDCHIHESNQVSDKDEYHCQEEIAQASEYNCGPMERTKIEDEKIRNESKSNQYLVEKDTTQGDQSQSRGSLSLPSSDSGASKGSVFSFAKESYGCTPRSCSDTESQNSDSFEHNSTKGNNPGQKSGNCLYYSNDRHSVQQEEKYRGENLSRVAELRIQHDNDYPTSRANSSNRSRWTERQHEFDSNRRVFFTNHEDRDFSPDDDGGRFLDKRVQTNNNRHPHRKYTTNYKDKEELHDWTRDEYPCRRNFRFCGENDVLHEGQDHHSFKRKASYQDGIAFNYEGCKRFNFKDGTLGWRGKSENLESANMSRFATCFPDKKSDLVQDKNGQSVAYANLTEGYYDKRLKGPRSLTRRNIHPFEKRVRYSDISLMDSHNAWGMEIEDEHQNFAYRPRREFFAGNDRRFADRITLGTDVCSTGLTETYRTRGRQSFNDDYRFADCDGSWNDRANVKDRVMYPDNGFHLERSKYRALRRVSESISRYGYDDVYAERISYPCERNARQGNDERLVDHILSEQHRYNLIREEDRRGVMSKNHGMIQAGESEKIFRSCGYPADMTLGNGKSSGRYFYGRGRLCKNKLEVADMELSEKKTISKKFGESVKGKTLPTTIQNGQRRFVKAAASDSNLDMEVEEGQIVAEEQKMEWSNPNHSSETAIRDGKMRTFNTKMDSGGSGTTRELDEQQILESLAKMERRRERFKDPVSQNMDRAGSCDGEVGSGVKCVEQGKACRKRRWSGA